MPQTLKSTHFHAVHDCSTHRLSDIEQYCALKGLRFTKLRKQIYQLIIEAKKPIGAYELLDALTTDKKRAAPPTVYRSLEFLLENGFIHRLASSNTYIPCCHPRSPHEAAFLICERCNSVQEFSKNPLFNELETLVIADGFKVRHSVVEITGVCSSCL